MRETFKIKGTNIEFADNYSRVVIGGQGPYIEFDAMDICVKLVTKPGQEYRGKGNYISCKYFWLCPVDHENIKVYHQRGIVSYADYKVGKYYVSPNDLSWESEELYAESGDAPGKARPGTYRRSK